MPRYTVSSLQCLLDPLHQIDANITARTLVSIIWTFFSQIALQWMFLNLSSILKRPDLIKQFVQAFLILFLVNAALLLLSSPTPSPLEYYLLIFSQEASISYNLISLWSLIKRRESFWHLSYFSSYKSEFKFLFIMMSHNRTSTKWLCSYAS